MEHLLKNEEPRNYYLETQRNKTSFYLLLSGKIFFGDIFRAEINWALNFFLAEKRFMVVGVLTDERYGCSHYKLKFGPKCISVGCLLPLKLQSLLYKIVSR